jgi:hypothetical protein
MPMNLANLIEWWDCDEASGDILGKANGLHLTHTNNPGATTIAGRAARLFDRVSAQQASRADSAALSIGTGESFTIAFRTRFHNSNAAAAGDHGLVAKADASGHEFGLFARANAGLTDASVFFSITGVGSVSIPEAAFAFDTDDTIIAEFNQPSGIMRMTLDDNQGSPFETTGLSGSVTDGTAPFRIGHVSDTTTEKYNGRIGSVAYFRGLLSSADKTTFYNGGAGISFLEASGSPRMPANANLVRPFNMSRGRR